MEKKRNGFFSVIMMMLLYKNIALNGSYIVYFWRSEVQ